MRKKIFLYAILISTAVVKAQMLQQFNLNFGKQYSSFLYSDANGNTDTNLTYRSGNFYAASVGLKLNERNFLRPEINFVEAGAQSEFLETPIYYNLNYLGMNCSYLFSLLNKERFSLSTGASLGFDYLLKGEQLVGNTRYNLKENNALKTWDMNCAALTSGRFMATENLFLVCEYRFRYGLNQIEKADASEKTHNIGHLITLGLSFNLQPKK